MTDNFLHDIQHLSFMSLVPGSMLANTWYWSDHGTPVGKMNILILKQNSQFLKF
jgi:hypothetical protein